MKRITPLKIILWSLVAIAGFCLAILTALLPGLAVFFWILAALVWCGDAAWIAVAVVRLVRGKQAAGTALVGNRAVMERTLRETREAVGRYLSSVNRAGLFKGSALYERPWFLLCGTEKSGKSSLLRGSGLAFPLQYPSDRDGAFVEGAPQVRWYFGNEAVWIDTPGFFMAEGGRDEWQSLIEALRSVRPDRPVDGVALTVNVSEILNADDLRIKELAARLRGRIDDLMARWGIEFPVYLLFNRTDEMPGFNDYFSDQAFSAGDQVFGATLPQTAGSAVSVRLAFAEEFALLCKSLGDFRLDRLHKERDAGRKRMICRFVIHFQGIQQKLGVLAAELFKESNYVGRPIFRGFYFTSCRPLQTPQATAPAASESAVGATIAGHPFNPHRVVSGGPAQGPASGGGRDLRSLFVLPLFRGIMVWDKPLVKATQQRSRAVQIRRGAIVGALCLGALLLSGNFVAGSLRVARFYHEAAATLSRLPPESAPLLDQFLAIDKMQSIMATLQRFEDRPPPVVAAGLYRPAPVLRTLKRGYFYRLQRCMIAPAVKFFEYDIRGNVESFAELTGAEYDRLYRSLKAYLSISEAAANHPRDIDTAFLHPLLFDAIRQSILSSTGEERLPARIEAVLQQNMGLLLTYLRRGEFPVIQENQRIVTDARNRLRRLPGAPALYDAVMGRLAQDAQQVTLDQLLGRSGSGILATDKVMSVLFSQQGWDQVVKPALAEAAENPYRADWVIGISQQDVPAEMPDKGKLIDEMEGAYCADFGKKWCDFLGSVEPQPFVDLPQSSRMLQMLAAEQSELQKLLDAVGKATLIKNQNAVEKAGAGLLAAAAKFKATASAAKAAGRAEKKVALLNAAASSFDELGALFDDLRAFVASSGGSLSGWAGYREKVLSLVDKLNAVESGAVQITAVFTGRDDDPLYGGWKFVRNTAGLAHEPLAAGLGRLLARPFELTASAVAASLSRELNSRWQSEVVKPFTSRLSGRYPFSGRGEDASWSECLDYFRPATGVFWGFYDRILSSYVVKAPSGWMIRQIGAMKLNFNPDLSASLSGADTIRNIFFKPDGTVRFFDLTISASGVNKNAVKLEVGGQVAELSGTARIRWPGEGPASAAGASLRIQTGRDFWQDLSFRGEWGFLKLLAAARVNRIRGDLFSARWQVNVQNMYTVNVETRMQVSSADHPFCEPLFSKFNCPDNLIIAEKKE